MSDTALLSTAACAALAQVVNAALALDPPTLERLAALQGKVVSLHIDGLEQTLYLLPGTEGLDIYAHFDGEVDTRLSGTPLALARMSTSARPGETMFGAGVRIDGDVELGQRFKAILARLDIDWEEHLSRLVGDVVAHQAGRLVRSLFGWSRHSAEVLGEDTADYLVEERQWLPHRVEVGGFLNDVDTLRSDAARLEARIARLQRMLTPSSD